MSELTVVQVARNSVHAKLIVALLEAEGIKANVEGDRLADPVAVSRRLMNTAGTQVKVRDEDVERAREIIAAAADEIDAAELEKQALEARDPEEDPESED